YYRIVPRGARIYGVIVVFATILAHGALYTSVGLALAVWIKRQSRAIAISVALFVFVTAAWPTLVSIVSRGQGCNGQGIASLSPVMTLMNSIDLFMTRRYLFNVDVLWWGTLWAALVLSLALGLVWLTVRTFDACFDRITDHPRQILIQAVLVVIVGVMI